MGNVTTLRSGICYCKSRNPSVVCDVRTPYSGGRNFRQHFFAILYLSHRLTSVTAKFYGDRPREPLRRGHQVQEEVAK